MGTEVRSALVIASDTYDDPGLRQLRAPAADAVALARVLGDPQIGGFDVTTLLNRPAHEVNLAVEDFFADRGPDDLLLVHFSGHGVKDESGDLYFAMTDTRLSRLGATGVSAEFVNRRMARSRSRRVVLLLDCCYAGAFERGMTHRADAGVGIESQFGGRGRAVVTASSAVEYAFEGDVLTDTTDTAPSIFTRALVSGLESGDADRDQDGLVALDELYDYVYEKVRAATPHQTPGKWTFGVEGELVIARRGKPVTAPAPLPDELRDAIGSPLPPVRAVAVQELQRLLEGRHAGLALAARLALQHLTYDDSRTVATAAAGVLAAAAEEPRDPPPASGPPSTGAGTTAPEPAAPPAGGSGRPARRRLARRSTLVAAAGAVAVAAVATIALVSRAGDGGNGSGSTESPLIAGIPSSLRDNCDPVTTDSQGRSTVTCIDGSLTYTLASSEVAAVRYVGDASGSDQCRSSPDPGAGEHTRYSVQGHTGTLHCVFVKQRTYDFIWHDDAAPLVIGTFRMSNAGFDTGLGLWEKIVAAS